MRRGSGRELKTTIWSQITLDVKPRFKCLKYIMGSPPLGVDPTKISHELLHTLVLGKSSYVDDTTMQALPPLVDFYTFQRCRTSYK